MNDKHFSVMFRYTHISIQYTVLVYVAWLQQHINQHSVLNSYIQSSASFPVSEPASHSPSGSSSLPLLLNTVVHVRLDNGFRVPELSEVCHWLSLILNLSLV